MKNLFAFLLILGFIVFFGTDVQAQCAMCRSTLESNVSNGEVGVSAQLNFGILYLLAAPYFLFSFMAYFWYRTSKKNGKRINISGYFKS